MTVVTYVINMCSQSLLTIFSASFIFQFCNSARILGIVSTPSYSHQIPFRPLWKELSLKGHQLTVLTTDPMNNSSLTNLTEINLDISYGMWNKNVEDMFKFTENPLNAINKMMSVVNELNDMQLQHLSVQAIIKNETEHFDLLITEMMPSMVAFAERFKCPFIGIMSMDPPSVLYSAIGNPTHPIVNPDTNLPFFGKLSFIERLGSTLFTVLFQLLSGSFSQQEVIEKNFGKGFPDASDISKNISMLFVNTDNIFHQIRPLVPTVVQIGGGIHRQPAQPLPKDLQKLLDGASQGFIYFSLGSNVKSMHLSESVRSTLLNVFAELPYLVLWKFELEELPNKPDNVVISKWFPQQDILGHPNIKLFITQGGQQSIEEAVLSHIPIIGMPFLGDQLGNINRMVHKGIGLHVDHTTLDKDSFKKTILEVINNPKYRTKIKELANLVQDQPMTGLERAVWWTEYVLRHKGAYHLRSPALDIPAYQYYLLDVIGFCLLVILIIVYLLMLLFKVILKVVKYFTFKPNEKKKML